jgi:hypothetical protein
MKKRITISVIIVCLAALNGAALEYDLSAYLRLVE